MLSRATTQKKIITEEIKKMKSFFDSERLHKQVIKKNPKIGIATIYRYLKNAVNNGEFHSYLCNRKRIYTLNLKNHSHFICESCENVKHINIKKLDFMKEIIKGKICHFQIDITGICDKCRIN